MVQMAQPQSGVGQVNVPSTALGVSALDTIIRQDSTRTLRAHATLQTIRFHLIMGQCPYSVVLLKHLHQVIMVIAGCLLAFASTC